MRQEYLWLVDPFDERLSLGVYARVLRDSRRVQDRVFQLVRVYIKLPGGSEDNGVPRNEIVPSNSRLYISRRIRSLSLTGKRFDGSKHE